MKYLKNILLIGIMLTSFSCTKNFEEINSDPNNAPITDASYVFNYVIKEGAGEYEFVNNYNHNFLTRWIMQTAAVWGNSTMPPYILFDQYRIQNLWEYYYSNLLLNCEVLKNLTSEKEEDVNKYQVARIWSVYCFHRVTDLWGDVPYSEAWKLLDGYSESNIKPKYDTQEEIYADMLAELDDAVNTIDPTMPFFEKDMLFDGDLNNWIKFANSLRLRLAVRIGNQTVVSDIISENNLISSNSENAEFSYIESQEWWNPYYELRTSSPTSVPKISWMLVASFESTNDPRLPYYAEPTDVNGSYVGVYNLMDANKKENQALGVGVASTSYIGTHFTENPAYTNQLLTYSEVCLLRSEAALRGWTGESAQEWYENGVRASMDYFNISSDDITEYITNGYPYIGTIEQIITQKWMSLFMNGYEVFAEFRRTGFPKLYKIDLELNGLIIISAELAEVERSYIPGRLAYPDTELDYNGENYNDALTNQNLPNDPNQQYHAQVWWSTLFGTVDY